MTVNPFESSVCAVLFGLIALPAHAQWSDDPMTNLGIAVTAGDQNQAKVVPTSDGGAYISWFGNPGGGYDVYLQRLDAQGNPQFAANGILIADRSFSSTQDYGLSVDSSDRALLTFRDDRLGGVQITATRVSGAGLQDWGPLGVQLTADIEFKASPKIAALGDGRTAVGWTHGSNTRIDVLDAAGASVLKSQIVITDSPGAASMSMSDLQASDRPGVTSGNFVALWVRQAGSTRQLQTRALDSSGAVAWNHGSLFTTGSIQFGNFPTFVSDGLGGAVYAWYQTAPLQCYAQWVDDTGAAQWSPAPGGLPLSTNATRVRVSPGIAFNSTNLEAFAFWTEQNSLQSMHGLYGQRIDEDGTRLWGADGLELIPLGANPITQVRSLVMDDAQDGAATFYVEELSFGNQRVRGAGLDGAGSRVWPGAGGLIDISTVASSKSRLAAAASTDHVAILAWSDGRNDSGDIYGQNVNPDGSIGGPSDHPADLNGDGFVNGLDLGILLANWSIPPDAPGCGGATPCASDINGDGFVNGLDLGILLASWTI